MFIRLLILLSASLAAAFGQEFRATLSGQVTDPSGAAIPAAAVKAINVDTGVTKETRTASDGLYSIPYLDPGAYTVEASAPGFQLLKREAIVLEVAAKVNLPLRLTVGQMSQEVTVVGQQELIDSATADRGLVFDPIKTQEYPLNGRQTYMLLSLTPGVVFTQEQFGAGGFSGTRGWDVNNSYKINGARTGENLFLLNGAPISNNSGTWQLAPNIEAVQEFKVMTNTYDAAYGRFGGGVVNTTVKSGTNAWHGDLFEYWRNRVLDANTFQNNVIGAPKGFHNQHQFGGVAGGPIRKDKDFIFASFEGWQEVVPFPALASTPPLALRDGQHFTQFGYKIYDPLTTHLCNAAVDGPCQGQTYIANQFPGNVIPASRISPVGAKILSYYPAPNGAGINNNYVAASNLGRYYYQQPMTRWDHIFGQNDKLYAVYTGFQGHEYRSVTGFPIPLATGNTNNQRTDQNAILAETHVFSANTVMDVRLSFGRFVQTSPGFSDFSVTAQTLGMTQLTPSPTSPGPVAPSINIGGYSNPVFSSGTAFAWNSFNQWNFAPSLTMNRGKHTLRAGFEFNYVMNGNVNTGSSNGSFTFNQNWTQQFYNRQQGTLDGSGVATLLLGYPTSGNIAYNDTQYRTRPYYAGYVHDDWKVSSRLTLNLGLRYEVQLGWLERYGRENRGFDTSTKNPLSDQILAAWAANKAAYDAANPNAKYPYPAPPASLNGGYVFPGKNGQPGRLYDTDWTNVGPRAGLAYRIGDKTVLRAGAGVYYQSTTQSGTATGFTQTTNYTTSLDGGITPAAGASLSGPFSLVNPFPNGFLAPTGSSAGLLTNVGNSISFDSPHFKVPRTYQYSFGIERELPFAIVAEVSYAGNYQNHINFAYDFDHQPLSTQLQAAADASLYSRSLPNPFYGIVPVTSSLGASKTISAATLLRPNPLFPGQTDNLVQQGWYRSDQLQVKLEKRVLGEKSGVMTWVLSYAFGKAFEVNHLISSFYPTTPVKELDNTDKAQNLGFSGVWDPPVGRGRRFLNVNNPMGRGLASNWRLAWTLSYLSGNPTNWPGGGATNPNYTNVCGSYRAPQQTENTWINNDKTCYVQQPTNTPLTLPDRFGNIRNPAQGPTLNLALEKTIPLTERYRVLLRVESFNLTNHPIRSDPDTSVTSPTFGQLPRSQENFPRLVQLAAKFYF